MHMNENGSTELTARNRLTHALTEMVKDAEHLLAAAQRTGTEEFDTARSKVERQVAHARAELSQLEDDMTHRARRAYRAADRAVHDHPYAAAGIALGACALVVGLLASRR